MVGAGFEFDYFISRAGPDRAIALEVAEVARALGRKTVIQDEDFPVGANFINLIHEGLTRSRQIVALLSRSYLEREFCLLELSDAIYRDPLGGRGRLILFRVDDCPLEGVLSARVYADLATAGDPAERRAKIRAGLENPVPGVFSLTSILGMPAHPCPFMGRTEALARLSTELGLVRQQRASRIVAIGGPRGIGKRSLIARFVADARAMIGGAIFCEASSPAEAQENLAGLLMPLAHRSASLGERQAICVEIATRIGRAEAPWLMAFRNPRAPETLDTLVPGRNALVVALCDTDERVEPLAGGWPEELRLGGLQLHEGEQLLEARAPGLSPETRARAAALLRGAPGPLSMLAEALSSLPPEEILDAVEKALEDPQAEPADALTDVLLVTAAQGDVAINDLLWKLATLGEHSVPLSLIQALAGCDAERALKLLERFGILVAGAPEREVGVAYIAAASRRRLQTAFYRIDQSERQSILASVCAELAGVVGSGVTEGFNALEHVVAVLAKVAEAGGPRGAGWNLLDAAWRSDLVPAGGHDAFLPFLVWAASETQPGSAIQTPAVQAALGRAWADAGDYDAARDAFDAACEAAKIGERNLDAASYALEAGRMARATGSWKLSVERLMEAVALAKGRDPQCLADALEALAWSLRALDGPTTDVLDCLREALSLRVEAYGAADPRVACLLRDLGAAYRDRKAYAEAESCLVEAVGLLVPHLDRHASDLAAAEGDLAVLYLDLGDAERAYPLSRRAYVTALDRLGTTHPLTRDLAEIRADVLEARGIPDEAQILRQRLAEGADATLRRQPPGQSVNGDG